MLSWQWFAVDSVGRPKLLWQRERLSSYKTLLARVSSNRGQVSSLSVHMRFSHESGLVWRDQNQATFHRELEMSLKIRTLSCLLACVAGSALVALSPVTADDKPKVSIKDAMKEHKKGGLKDKVLDGTATPEEKKKLADLYVEMAKNKPPKGTDESWKKLNDALIKASKEIVDGKPNGIEDLKKAVNCGACHSAHKAS